MKVLNLYLLIFVALTATIASAKEYHVSVNGNDTNKGTFADPFRTVNSAAQQAIPGDTITVHSGTYREWVNPPRGGESDAKRIVYRAAAGEKVEIKGSEVITGWKKFGEGVWKVVLPNSIFGDYNPYQDLIHGDWFRNKGRTHHTGEVYLNGKSLWESAILENVLSPKPQTDKVDPEGSTYTWYCKTDKEHTYLYANFHDANPNDEIVEINVRKSCFYPDTTGRNYITISGFCISQAATQWAPPTSEQIGLIGTNWSKGWIIENNVISNSKCTGITLGKYGDKWDNTSANSAEGYVKTIERAQENGWNKENIGHHIVRNNTIFNCEQAGICGSLGAIFSSLTHNHIYNIHRKQLFSGSEMAGIKIHAAIDVLIKNNRIHDVGFALWMDWMAQGTRISGNLCYNNTCDLLTEVNHGPFLVDNNIFLSETGFFDVSGGAAFAHNLMTGSFMRNLHDIRDTPYHLPHSTEVVALKNRMEGDNRFYNNVFAEGHGSIQDSHNGYTQRAYGWKIYDNIEAPMQVDGNVYYKGLEHYTSETNFVEKERYDPQIKIVDEGESVYLYITPDKLYKSLKTKLITTQILGKAMVPNLGFENPDGSRLKIDTDYFGMKRNNQSPSSGPFEYLKAGKQIKLKVW